MNDLIYLPFRSNYFLAVVGRIPVRELEVADRDEFHPNRLGQHETPARVRHPGRKTEPDLINAEYK